MSAAVYAPLLEQVRRVERILAKLYHNYDEKLKEIEARLREGYDPLLERAADNVAGILRVVSAALRLARGIEEALAERDERLVRLRVQRLEDEAERLRDQVYYGPVKLPTGVRVYIMSLVGIVKRLSGGLGEQR